MRFLKWVLGLNDKRRCRYKIKRLLRAGCEVVPGVDGPDRDAAKGGGGASDDANPVSLWRKDLSLSRA